MDYKQDDVVVSSWTTIYTRIQDDFVDYMQDVIYYNLVEDPFSRYSLKKPIYV